MQEKELNKIDKKEKINTPKSIAKEKTSKSLEKNYGEETKHFNPLNYKPNLKQRDVANTSLNELKDESNEEVFSWENVRSTRKKAEESYKRYSHRGLGDSGIRRIVYASIKLFNSTNKILKGVTNADTKSVFQMCKMNFDKASNLYIGEDEILPRFDMEEIILKWLEEEEEAVGTSYEDVP